MSDELSEVAPASAAGTDSPSSAAAALAAKFLSVKPREHGGGTAQQRFAYQRHWALVEMLRRHLAGDDYCFVFEYHDDVVIFDCSDDPSSVTFCQVKTTTKEYLAKTILLRKEGPNEGDASDATAGVAADTSPPDSGGTGKKAKGKSTKKSGVKKLSTLGKLYLNRENFREHTDALFVVTNAAYPFDLRPEADASQEIIRFDDLTDEEQSALLTHMTASFDATVGLDDLRLFHFARTRLALEDSKIHALGRLAAFLESEFPRRRIHLHALFRTLLTELDSRNHLQPAPTDFAMLVRTRGISRKDFEAFLHAATESDDARAAFEWIRPIVQNDGRWSLRRCLNFDRNWRTFELQRMDPFRQLERDLVERILPQLIQSRRELDSLGPIDIVDRITHALAADPIIWPAGYDSSYLDAAILFEWSALDGQHELSSADPATPEAAA